VTEGRASEMPEGADFGALPEQGRAVLAAMAARYACKRFDPRRPIPEDQVQAILEAGRLSPSSFGLEPWRFIVSRGTAEKEALCRACFDQENLRTASLVVSIAVRSAPSYHPESDFVRQRAARFPGGYPVFVADYRPYWEYLNAAGELDAWARSQAYIALANMMTLAAALGLDSCAIEGFREDEVRRILGLKPEDWRPAILVPFGYRDEAVRAKIREDRAALVENRW